MHVCFSDSSLFFILGYFLVQSHISMWLCFVVVTVIACACLLLVLFVFANEYTGDRLDIFS